MITPEHCLANTITQEYPVRTTGECLGNMIGVSEAYISRKEKKVARAMLSEVVISKCYPHTHTDNYLYLTFAGR